MNAAIEIILFTLAAIFLYFFSDWVLNQLERRRGARFQHRSLIFFAIIITATMLVFSYMRQLGATL
mgnify:CR=1 FL=1